MIKINNLIVAVSVGVVFLSAVPSHAYLDPGSGSMLLQILLGGLAGLVVFLRLFWHRILDLFGVRKSRNEETKSRDS